jgi:pyridoxamine 5'-phosphate oxidase family protein
MTANSPAPSFAHLHGRRGRLPDRPAVGRNRHRWRRRHRHVVPVGFILRTDQDVVDSGGLALTGSKTWRDLTATLRVALVVDDLESVDPWTPRGVEVRGRAELHEAAAATSGRVSTGPGPVSIPKRIIAWGVDGDLLDGPTAVTSTDELAPTQNEGCAVDSREGCRFGASERPDGQLWVGQWTRRHRRSRPQRGLRSGLGTVSLLLLREVPVRSPTGPEGGRWSRQAQSIRRRS